MKKTYTIIIVIVLIIAGYFLFKYLAGKAKLGANINLGIDSADVVPGAGGLVLNIKAQVDNPTNVTAKITRPYVIAKFTGNEIARSTPDVGYSYELKPRDRTIIPLKLEIPYTKLGLTAVDITATLISGKWKELLSNIRLDTETMLDVEGITIKVPYGIALSDYIKI